MHYVGCKRIVEQLHQPTQSAAIRSLENTRSRCPQSLGHSPSPGTTTQETELHPGSSSLNFHIIVFFPPTAVPRYLKAALARVQRWCVSNRSASCTLVYDFHPRGKALFVGSAAPSPSSVTATVTSDSAAAALTHDVTLPYRVWLIVQFASEHKLCHLLSKCRTGADVFVSLKIPFCCFCFIFVFITEGFSSQCSHHSLLVLTLKLSQGKKYCDHLENSCRFYECHSA